MSKLEPAIVLIVLVVLSIASFQRNRLWNQAETLWTDVVTKSPREARAHNNLGIAYEARGDIEGAMAEYQTAIRLDPDYLPAYGSLAVIYGKIGDLEKAIEIFLWLLVRHPRDFKSHTGLGVAFMLKGLLMEAEWEFQDALRIKPGYETARDNLEEVWRLKGLRDGR
jgi:Flp pilus assembly protein TadD